jgi:hypothetical protein
MKSMVGARGTGKRLINVRHFVEDYYQSRRSQSDPFVDSVLVDDESYSVVLPSKLKFKSDYIAESESEETDDEILPKALPDLDKSAKFVASLKIQKPTKKSESKKYVIDCLGSYAADLERFRIASESLSEMKMKDAVEAATESESESLI